MKKLTKKEAIEYVDSQMLDLVDASRKKIMNIEKIYSIRIGKEFYSFTTLVCDYICKMLPTYINVLLPGYTEKRPNEDLIINLVKEFMEEVHTDEHTYHYVLENLEVKLVEENDRSDAMHYIGVTNRDVRFIQGY